MKPHWYVQVGQEYTQNEQDRRQYDVRWLGLGDYGSGTEEGTRPDGAGNTTVRKAVVGAA